MLSRACASQSGVLASLLRSKTRTRIPYHESASSRSAESVTEAVLVVSGRSPIVHVLLLHSAIVHETVSTFKEVLGAEGTDRYKK